jgi:hypothetical protein
MPGNGIDWVDVYWVDVLFFIIAVGVAAVLGGCVFIAAIEA